jgi:ribonuclease HII
MLESRFNNDTIIEIGIDEAGRGSFWGHIMAGAVIIPNESTWTDKQRKLMEDLKDSKKISPKKRNRLADDIKELLPQTGVGIVTADEINTHGITWANMEAFKRAVYSLGITETELKNTRLIIDGVLAINDWSGTQELIVEGDSKYLAIAGASILAKVSHDQWIQKYCEDNPTCDEMYDLVKCKGYGTVKHRNGIRIYGAHELHRTLYIQNWLPGATQKVKTKKAAITKSDKCLINFQSS